MLKRSEMIMANIERLEDEMDYIEVAMSNKEFRSGFPRVFDKLHVCAQELNIELQNGIVAQLPLTAAYFDLDAYVALYLEGARRYHMFLSTTYAEAKRAEAGATGLSGPIGDLPSYD